MSLLRAFNATDPTYGPRTSISQAQRWSTTADQANKFSRVSPAPFASTTALTPNAVVVDPGEMFQSYLGVGAALSDSAAYCLWNYLTPTQRTALLTELFAPDQCAWSMLRICIGASDFSAVPFYSYDDMLSGQTDPNLVNFTVAKDANYIIPIIQEILAINPGLRILGTPWTAPGWMKDNASLIGGNFVSANYAAYAQYFVKFVQAYQSYGIPIWGVCPVNEPDAVAPYPSMNITAAQSIAFIGQHLGPALDTAGLNVKIITLDEGWGSYQYGLTVAADTTAMSYLDGFGWHGYNGDPSKQTVIHRAAPTKHQYFTEMRTLLSQDWPTSLALMAGQVFVGSLRNWGRATILWNLALDQTGQPVSTSTGRRGVITIANDGSGTTTRFAEYYVMRHFAAVAPGARRIAATSTPGGVETVAFVNPDNSIVLAAYNNSATDRVTQIADVRSGGSAVATIKAGELTTLVWGTTAQNTPAAAPVTITTPGAPTLSVTPGPRQNLVTVTAPGSAGSSPIFCYRIYRGGVPVAALSAPGSYLDTGLTAGTTYAYTARAVNVGGNGTVSSTVNGVPTAATAPAAPVTSITVGTTACTLSWTPPSGQGAAVTGFTIYRATTSGAETLLTTVGAGVGTYSDAAPAGGTIYYYQVTATNSVGEGSRSNEVNTVPQAVAVDTTTTSQATTTSSLSWTHTVDPTANLAVVAVEYQNASAGAASVASVSFGGQAMTQVGTAKSGTTAAANRCVDIWKLINPPTGLSKTVSVSMTTPGGIGVVGEAVTFLRANDVGTPATNSSLSAASLSVTTTSPTTAIVLAATAVRSTANPTAGGGQATVYAQLQGTNLATLLTQQPGGTSVVSSASWTPADNSAIVAVPVLSQ